MSIWNSHARFFGGLGLAAALAGASLAGAESARAAGAFDAFLGNWSGGGVVTNTSNKTERIRCRASYTNSNTGSGLSQTISCASTSYKIEVESYVEATGSNVQGTWREDTRNVQGQLTGTIRGGAFAGTVVGPAFSARITLQSNGRKQRYEISPTGSEITNVVVDLDRKG